MIAQGRAVFRLVQAAIVKGGRGDCVNMRLLSLVKRLLRVFGSDYNFLPSTVYSGFGRLLANLAGIAAVRLASPYTP